MTEAADRIDQELRERVFADTTAGGWIENVKIVDPLIVKYRVHAGSGGRCVEVVSVVRIRSWFP